MELEYLGNDDSDSEYVKKTKPYQKEMDFAFFAVNLGYSKLDYEALTPTEKAFIYKAWENKLISDASLMYNAMFTALYNVNRPKNKKALKLWRKSKTHRTNEEEIRCNYAVALEADRNDGDQWVKRVYTANNLRLPERSKCG